MRLHKMDDFISFNDDKSWSDWAAPSEFFKKNDGISGAVSNDVIFLGDYKGKDDNVNHPAHYTQGTQEAIDIIEEAIAEAPGVKQGFLQAQVLKYLLRLWHKIDAKEDAEKARWYLNRLIDSLN